MYPQRKSLRLTGYNYNKSGFYFITICIYNGDYIFGRVKNNKMILNEKGVMINKWWSKLSKKFINIKLDKYVIMPNHIHGIINLVGADPGVCPPKNGENPSRNYFIHELEFYNKSIKGEHNKNSTKGEHMGSPLQASNVAIPRIVQWFKTMTTNEYIKNVKQKNWTPFYYKLWQRSYYDHIIKTKKELFAIRKYILNNPSNWDN